MAPTAPLQSAIDQVEQHLAALGEALRLQQPEAVAAEAAALQRALQPLRRAQAAPGSRSLLALAAARTAAQREALARAGAAAERGLQLLLPGTAPGAAYSASGLNPRAARSGLLRA